MSFRIGPQTLIKTQMEIWSYINSLEISLKEQLAYYAYVEADADKKMWYFNIMRYLEYGVYLVEDSNNHKKKIWCFSKNYFPSRDILHWRTPNLGFLRCFDVIESMKPLEEVHARLCRSHMNGFSITRKIMKSCYF